MSAYCPRYYQLRAAWEMAEVLRYRPDAPDNARAVSERALEVLRVHAEECKECEAALFGAFPETAGKARHSESVRGLG